MKIQNNIYILMMVVIMLSNCSNPFNSEKDDDIGSLALLIALAGGTTGTGTETGTGTTTYSITTLAGSSSTGSIDGTGTAARFNTPYKITIDSSGNLFVADQINHIIRRITSTGIVTTLAGSAGLNGTVNGTGTGARFNGPSGITIDNSGNLYITDSANHTIRRVTSAGTVTTFAGVAQTSGSADGNGSNARFNNSAGITRDSAGNLYVADSINQTIRKITSSGDVTTLAGGVGVSGSTDGTGTSARFNNPSGITVDSSGNLYVTDFNNHTIRRITSAGVVTTVAGGIGVSGSTDGTGTSARFNNPSGITVDSSGNLFVTDFSNHTIRRITSAGVVTTVAGGVGVSGSTDGTGTSARFNQPGGIALDSSGNLYVTEYAGHRVRKLTPQ